MSHHEKRRATGRSSFFAILNIFLLIYSIHEPTSRLALHMKGMVIMRDITKEELNVILENHKHWLNGDIDGWEKMRADLSYTNLEGADLSGAELHHANLYCANLKGANLSGAYLLRAFLYRANLYCANLIGADLSGANLKDANISGADLSGANLKDANLEGAIMILYLRD